MFALHSAELLLASVQTEQCLTGPVGRNGEAHLKTAVTSTQYG